jgi:transcriptional regulator with XRE-family HTH domain
MFRHSYYVSPTLLFFKKRGFSQEGFAHECGFNRSYMGAVERGEKNITLAMMRLTLRNGSKIQIVAGLGGRPEFGKIIRIIAGLHSSTNFNSFQQ